jgi:mRNA interferase MazF
VAETEIAHPCVVVQADVLNHSRLETVVVCALSTNLKRAKAPGNVLLELGEANLPKPSVVIVSQISSINKTQLGDYIGTLSSQRVAQILTGLNFLHTLMNRPSDKKAMA